MLKTIERYRNCKYATLEASRPVNETQTQYILDQLSDLRRREQALSETNKALLKKLEESYSLLPLRHSWGAGDQNTPYSRIPSSSDGFFQPLYCNSALQFGFNPLSANERDAPMPNQNVSGFIPGWTL
ncbi:hypothetical protein Nepgr_018867 [Nepenthes gracilis]|uniref:Uncharacterized protein n=1 Tax=Nepenthes gracilis TaxID=150966 RepID=A0AAD3XUR2_NEPGR|nr:hypothetical protein Nepgr_018867 [Nepenthes gracilis]